MSSSDGDTRDYFVPFSLRTRKGSRKKRNATSFHYSRTDLILPNTIRRSTSNIGSMATRDDGNSVARVLRKSHSKTNVSKISSTWSSEYSLSPLAHGVSGFTPHSASVQSNSSNLISFEISSLDFDVREQRWSINGQVNALISRFENRLADELNSRDVSKMLTDSLSLPMYHNDLVFIQFLHRELRGSYSRFMSHKFANYFLQEFLKHCTRPMVADIVREVRDFLPQMSIMQSGSRAVQRLISRIEDEETAAQILPGFVENIETICLDPRGNHVVQTILSEFRYFACIRPLVEEISAVSPILLETESGCSVVYKQLQLFSMATNSDLISRCVERAADILNLNHGYFIIRYLVDQAVWNRELLEAIVRADFLSLARKKYVSNILENLVLQAGEDDALTMMVVGRFLELVCGSEAPEKYFYQLLRDPYANYVVQAILRISPREVLMTEMDGLINYIIGYIYELKCGLKLSKLLRSKGFSFRNKEWNIPKRRK